MINVLYVSLTVPIKLWNLKVQIIKLNFPRLCVFPLKIITHWYSRRRTRLHDSLHPLHKSLVFTGLWSSDESELHGPELDHQSIENKVLIWSIHESITVPLYSNGTCLIGQGIKNTFNLLKPVIPKVSLKGHFGTQSKTKKAPEKRRDDTLVCIFFNTSQRFNISAIDAIVAISWTHGSSPGEEQ